MVRALSRYIGIPEAPTEVARATARTIRECFDLFTRSTPLIIVERHGIEILFLMRASSTQHAALCSFTTVSIYEQDRRTERSVATMLCIRIHLMQTIFRRGSSNAV
jgi:hypothetical protein